MEIKVSLMITWTGMIGAVQMKFMFAYWNENCLGLVRLLRLSAVVN